MKTTMEMMVGCLAACCAFNAMATEPTISDVTVRQRWPWSRLVDIDYVLTCDDTQRVDIVLNAYNGPTALSLPESSLSGNLYNVTEGPRRIVWDPTATAYTNSQMLTQFNVTLATAPLPVYMIVDLTLAAGAEGQIEYVYPGDERLVTDGRFTNVWFSVTNDTKYMTTKLVMRRISAGSYTMGSSTPVTMTNDFYAGVFEVTQEQWKNIYASYAGAFITERATRPAESTSYNTIRGATNSSPVVNWPSTGHTVTPDSFIGMLRKQTGLSTFDLPTEAQWEYICRAGTTTYYNDGEATAPNDGVSANTSESNTFINVLGRYKYNGGKIFSNGTWNDPPLNCGTTNGTAIVGSYRPNNWGLYDTHGNVWEYCLEWFDNAGNRVRRGGAYSSNAAQCASVSRNSISVTSGGNYVGLRLIRNLP